MIDTLARHIAALSEARRLVAMILTNNPAFKALLQAKAGQQIDVVAHLERVLATDKVYLAYCQLGEALADVQPVTEDSPCQQNPPPGTLADQVALLPLVMPVVVEARPAPPCARSGRTASIEAGLGGSRPSPPSGAAALGDRVREVLAATAMADGPPAKITAALSPGTLPPRGVPRDEASVAIIRRDSQSPKSPPSRATPSAGPGKPVFRLFPNGW